LILGAIDIGSNAARLLITEVIDQESDAPIFNKLNLFRVPIRLGFDVFENGLVSLEKTEMLVQTLKSSLEEGFLPGGGSFYLFLKENRDLCTIDNQNIRTIHV
jgi:hypothetical protein